MEYSMVMKGRRYLGQVRDGVFYDLRKKKEIQ
jgi:hypothetical protein